MNSKSTDYLESQSKMQEAINRFAAAARALGCDDDSILRDIDDAAANAGASDAGRFMQAAEYMIKFKA